MFETTSEQDDAIQSVLDGYHVQVMAIPGSGKSRLAYETIRRCDDECMLVIVYNRALNDSTTDRLQSMDIGDRRVKSYTFHGLVSALTNRVCFNDQQLFQFIEELPVSTESIVENWKWADFSLLIIDEAQDMRPSFFYILKWLIGHVCQRKDDLRIVLLGDEHQLLYDFYSHDRADARFLSMGMDLLKDVNRRSWKEHRLSRSFRSTMSVSVFLNTLLGYKHMLPKSQDSSEPVDLFVCDIYTDVVPIVRKGLDNGKIFGFVPGDTMVLCQSMNQWSPAKGLVDLFIDKHIPIYVNRSGSLSDTQPFVLDTEYTKTDDIQDVVSFKTFCSSKGLENKLIIVINSRPLFEKPRCENSLYVGLSRSSNRMMIFQDHRGVHTDDLDGFVCAYDHQYGKDTREFVRIHICKTLTSKQKRIDVPKPDRDYVRLCIPETLVFTFSKILENIRKEVWVENVNDPIPECTYDDMNNEQRETIDVPNKISIQDTFARFFCSRDRTMNTNIVSIVGQTISTLVEFHFTHTVPRRFKKLRGAKSSKLRSLYNDTMSGLTHLGTYTGNKHRLIYYAQFIGGLCLLIDAYVGYIDKVYALHDYSIFGSTHVMDRVFRIIDSITSSGLCIRSQNGWYKRCSWKTTANSVIDVDDCVLASIHSSACIHMSMETTFIDDHSVLLFINNASIETKDIVHAGLLSYITRDKQNNPRIVDVYNTQNTAHMRVRSTNKMSNRTIGMLLRSKFIKEPTFSNDDFVSIHKYVTPIDK